ncbi:hypothetical protein CHLRE_08g370083v5 [Chlamydomonas reinhardtii]|uniref:Transposase n=1 Tax=Chlamydomonas reinhardtii TaxID=3055 RepID=A0A2K3DH47_CHLRE|nr:uncharacterized protein CHLRE_08g370083v5 [Chlamydomonas reinhardtii]PNW79873.1 hypothetical protein CHLRE_08g370083v5 [Chlamydomonas reinhardtii]
MSRYTTCVRSAGGAYSATGSAACRRSYHGGGSRAHQVQVCNHCGTGWGRDVNSATNIRHALVEILLGHKRPASLQTGGGSGGGGGGSGSGGGGGSSGGACAHLGSGGGGKGHVEEESAAPPKKRRKRAG